MVTPELLRGDIVTGMTKKNCDAEAAMAVRKNSKVKK